MSIRKILSEQKLNGILVTKPENVRYFTDFVGSFGQVILTKNKKILLTDPRYSLQAKKLCCKDTEVIIFEDYQEQFEKTLKKLRIKNLGLESTHLSYYKFNKYKKMLKGKSLKALGNDIDLLRIVKSTAEIKLIQKSQNINEKTLKEAKRLLKKGITEAELAWKIIDIGHHLGAEDISFEPIVAFGKNSASPHYTPSRTKYKKEDVVLIDMGMKYKGYCSDMTRTFLPKKASNTLIEHYNIVLGAQENCIKKLNPGDRGSKGDELSRSIIDAHNLAEHFTHANGHGVGLEIHEAPSLSSKQKHTDRTMKLKESMVVTVEPGIYLEGKYGIRIEDMIVIQKGKNKNLTKFPKKVKDMILK